MKLVAVLGFTFIFSIYAYAAVELGKFQGPFGNDLNYVVSKKFESSNNLFIFVEGDGDVCFEYDERNARGLLQELALFDSWVAYETSKSRYCKTKELGKIDFFHRVDELTSLVQQLRKDIRGNYRIYFVAHSGGPKIALQAFHRLPGQIEGLVLMSGGLLPLDAMITNEILVNGFKQNRPEADIFQEIDQVQSIFSNIKNNCESPGLLWGTRSNKFWCQMFQPTFLSNILNVPNKTKLFIVHGYLDEVVPVEEAFVLYSRLLKENKAVSLKIIRSMDHSFFPYAGELVESISKWASK